MTFGCGGVIILHLKIGIALTKYNVKMVLKIAPTQSMYRYKDWVQCFPSSANKREFTLACAEKQTDRISLLLSRIDILWNQHTSCSSLHKE